MYFLRRRVFHALQYSLLFLVVLLPLKTLTATAAWSAFGSIDLGTSSCAGAPSNCGGAENKLTEDIVDSQNATASACLRDEDVGWKSESSTIFTLNKHFDSDYISKILKDADGRKRCISFGTNNSSFYVTSAVWDQNDRDIIVLDPRKNLPLRFVPSYSFQEAYEEPFSGLREPVWIQRSVSGYIFERKGGVLVETDESNRLGDDLVLLGSTDAEGKTLKSVVRWVRVTPTSYAVFGDLLRPDKEWESGVVLVDPETKNFTTIIEIPLESRKRDFFHLGYPLLASLDGQAFALLVDESSEIAVVSANQRSSIQVPDSLASGGRSLGVIPLGDPGTLLAATEKLSLPVALYSWRSHLYLLTREYSHKESRIYWYLAKIDPCSKKLTSRIFLPSESPHLVLVPGRDFWAIVERGAYGRPEFQKIQQVRYIPSYWIEENRPELLKKPGSFDELCPRLEKFAYRSYKKRMDSSENIGSSDRTR